MSPALLGLLLVGAAVARERQRVRSATRLSKVALLRTPEEVEVPALMARRAELDRDGARPSRGRAQVPRAQPRSAAGAHRRQSSRVPSTRRAAPIPNAFTAQQKLIDARSLEEALGWLTRVERVEVAGSARLLNQLAQLPDAQPPTLLI